MLVKAMLTTTTVVAPEFVGEHQLHEVLVARPRRGRRRP